MTITSKDNDKLKQVRKLARKAERERTTQFVAEGEDLLAAADAAGRQPVLRLCAAGSGLDGDEVEPALLDGVSALGSGVRTLAVYEQRWEPARGPLCVCLHGVSDPGNIGAVLRSAVAFGAACVALGPGCADPFSPKAVRASMGAIFTLAPARVRGPGELPGERVALVAHAGESLQGPIAGDVSVIVGAERAGLPDEVVAACDRVAHIPITGGQDSLNAAMAATVALYELTSSSHRMARP